METAASSSILTRYAALFAEADLPYMVVGSFAVLVHGTPRLSSDLDIAVYVSFDQRKPVESVLQHAGYGPFEERSDPQWGQRLACWTPENIQLEVFFVPDNPVAEREFSRAVVKEIHGVPVRVISPEDLVLRKLVNTRLRRGEDFDDAVGVLARNWQTFDRDYIRAHCGPHRVCALFDKALQEARPFAEGVGDD